MKKIDIDKDILTDLYVNKNLSQEECGNILGCSQALISKKLKEYDIKARRYGEHQISKTMVQMTDEMTQIFDGAILGDGSIRKNAVNASFYYGSKSRQHVDYVCNLFKDYSSGDYIHYRHRYDKRTEKYYDCYEYYSIVSPSFTKEYDRWYPDGTKHIPKDLILTPLICKVWYVGDGSLTTPTDKSFQRISLYTNSFLKEEIESILLPQLKSFEPCLQLMDRKKVDGKGYVINICKKENIIKFIDYIGECPFDDYKYKWNIKPSELKELHKFSEEWIHLYNAGIQCSLISKIYGCSFSSVDRILKMNKIQKGELKPDYLYRWMSMLSEGYTIKEISDKYINICNKKEITKCINYFISNNIQYDISNKKGVFKIGDYWHAGITIDKKWLGLGKYNTFNEAVNARIYAEDKYYTLQREQENNEKS